MMEDFGAITGNPVKFGLGFVSMFADVTFIIQHYILYPNPPRHAAALVLPVLAQEGSVGAGVHYTVLVEGTARDT